MYKIPEKGKFRFFRLYEEYLTDENIRKSIEESLTTEFFATDSLNSVAAFKGLLEQEGFVVAQDPNTLIWWAEK